MNPIFDTLSDFNRSRMETDPRGKLLDRLLWVNQFNLRKPRRVTTPARTPTTAPSYEPKILVGDSSNPLLGSSSPPPEFRTYVAVWGQSEAPDKILFAHLNPKLEMIGAGSSAGGR